MSKSKVKLERWYAKDIGCDYWYMESSDGRHVDIKAHCKCCAYAEVIANRGGDCDLRGLSQHGMCYSFLQAMVNASRHGGEIETED